MSQVNIPIVNLGYLNVQGLELAWVSNTSLSMALGQARDSSNVNDIVLNAPVTINAATNGINGLDTGVLVLSALYAVYVVGDSSGNNASGACISANASAPLLPVGYDMYRRIGWIRTDASVHFLLGYWTGNRNQRQFVYDVPIATGITAGSSATYAPVVLTTFVPAFQNVLVNIEANWTANAAGDTMALQPFGATGDTLKYIAAVAGSSAHTLVREFIQAQLNVAAPEINYKVSAGSLALNVAGYQYSI